MTVFNSQQLPSEHENTKNMYNTDPHVSSSFSKVQDGLEFILSHFQQEPLFPRKIATAATRNEQKPVDDKDRAMLYYQAALWEDCRISAFGLEQQNPDLIFIDLDAENFTTLRSFKLALTKTLKNIKEKLNGHPTLIWSGRGYHIIQPINCPVRLEDIKELAALEPTNTSTKFLQFCERYLSAKADKSHHPALKSCQLRIPGSLNSKCRAVGADPEVKILQSWDGHRPDYTLLLGSFYADLVGKNQQLYRKKLMHNRSTNAEWLERWKGTPSNSGVIFWIEKLLQTPIEDYRKRARDLILVPYLVVRRGMTDIDQISDVIMKWAEKCSELRRLELSSREFERRVRTRIQESMHDRIPPMKLATLKERNPELYEKLIVVVLLK